MGGAGAWAADGATTGGPEEPSAPPLCGAGGWQHPPRSTARGIQHHTPTDSGVHGCASAALPEQRSPPCPAMLLIFLLDA